MATFLECAPLASTDIRDEILMAARALDAERIDTVTSLPHGVVVTEVEHVVLIQEGDFRAARVLRSFVEARGLR